MRYDNMAPLEIAEQFIDSFMKKTPVEKLVPGGISNYLHGVFLSGVEKVYLQNNKEEYGNYIKEFLDRVLEEDKKLKRLEGSFWCSLNSLDFRQVGNLLCRMYEETGEKSYL